MTSTVEASIVALVTDSVATLKAAHEAKGGGKNRPKPLSEAIKFKTKVKDDLPTVVEDFKIFFSRSSSRIIADPTLKALLTGDPSARVTYGVSKFDADEDRRLNFNVVYATLLKSKATTQMQRWLWMVHQTAELTCPALKAHPKMAAERLKLMPEEVKKLLLTAGPRGTAGGAGAAGEAKGEMKGLGGMGGMGDLQAALAASPFAGLLGNMDMSALAPMLPMVAGMLKDLPGTLNNPDMAAQLGPLAGPLAGILKNPAAASMIAGFTDMLGDGGEGSLDNLTSEEGIAKLKALAEKSGLTDESGVQSLLSGLMGGAPVKSPDDIKALLERMTSGTEPPSLIRDVLNPERCKKMAKLSEEELEQLAAALEVAIDEAVKEVKLDEPAEGKSEAKGEAKGEGKSGSAEGKGESKKAVPKTKATPKAEAAPKAETEAAPKTEAKAAPKAEPKKAEPKAEARKIPVRRAPAKAAKVEIAAAEDDCGEDGCVLEE